MKCSDTLTSVESLSLLDEKIAKFNEVVLFLKLSVIYKKECVQGHLMDLQLWMKVKVKAEKDKERDRRRNSKGGRN